jgi:hypothetical protein
MDEYYLLIYLNVNLNLVSVFMKSIPNEWGSFNYEHVFNEDAFVVGLYTRGGNDGAGYPTWQDAWYFGGMPPMENLFKGRAFDDFKYLSKSEFRVKGSSIQRGN